MIRFGILLFALLICVPALAQPFGEPYHCDQQLHAAYNDVVEAYESSESAREAANGYILGYSAKIAELQGYHDELIYRGCESVYRPAIRAAQRAVQDYQDIVDGVNGDLQVAQSYASLGVQHNDYYCYAQQEDDKDEALSAYGSAVGVYDTATTTLDGVSFDIDTDLASFQSIINDAKQDLEDCRGGF